MTDPDRDPRVGATGDATSADLPGVDRDAPGMTPPPAPRASEVLGAALGDAARRAGLDPTSTEDTRQAVWNAMGGWRGILESVLPSLAFVVLFTFTQNLVLALAISVGSAAVFTLARLLQKQPPSAALGGLIAAVGLLGLAPTTSGAQPWPMKR